MDWPGEKRRIELILNLEPASQEEAELLLHMPILTVDGKQLFYPVSLDVLARLEPGGDDLLLTGVEHGYSAVGRQSAHILTAGRVYRSLAIEVSADGDGLLNAEFDLRRLLQCADKRSAGAGE